ncbi:MAG TPA: hypothetical protein VGF91_03140 [Solirubrobacteraceae bacterium]
MTVADPSRRLPALTVSVVAVGLAAAAAPARTRCCDQNRPIADTPR